MVDRRLLSPAVQDARGLAFLACIDQVVDINLDRLLFYWLDQTPAAALPFLAEQFHIEGYEGWSLAKTEQDQRNILSQAVALHRYKGTPWAVKNALAAVGWPGLEIVERAGHWAEFRVRQPIPDRLIEPSELQFLRAVVEAWAPVRCHLLDVQFLVNFEQAVTLPTGLWDGSMSFDGRWAWEGDPIAALADIGFGVGGVLDYWRPLVPGSVEHASDARAVIRWDLPAAERNGSAIDTFALRTKSGVEVARRTRAALQKTPDLSLEGSWVLNIARP